MEYSNGSIISLKLQNFQTYDYQEFKFSPGLNLIAGPNGSGKSSIANSFALIFNGSPKTIGKSKNIIDFIKFGKKVAIIECCIYKTSIFKLRLSQDQENSKVIKKSNQNRILLKRIINCSADNKEHSEYFVNDKLYYKKDYFQFVDKIGYNCNNLTNFLPQEKVSEFSLLNSIDLFKETYPSLSDNSKNLAIEIDLFYKQQGEIELIEEQIKGEAKKMERIDSNLEILSKEMEKYISYLKNIRKIKLLSFKEHLENYSRTKDEYKKVKNDGKIIIEKRILEENEIYQLKEKIDNFESNIKIKNFRENVKKLETQNEEITEISDRIINNCKDFEFVKYEIMKIKKENETVEEENKINQEKREKEIKIYDELFLGLKSKVTEFIQKSKSVDLFNNLSFVKGKEIAISDKSIIYTEEKFLKINEKINVIKNYNNDENYLRLTDLESIIPRSDELEKKVKNTNHQIEKYKLKTGELQYNIERLTKEKLNYESEKVKRLEMLKKYHYDTFKAVEFLRKNDIGVQYLEPPFLHIEINNDFIEEIENLLGFISLTTFLFKDSSSMLKFSKEMKDKKKFAINVSVINFDDNYIERVPQNKLMELGFDGLAIDFIIASLPYKNFFCSVYNFNFIPISKKPVNENRVFRELKACKRMITNKQYIEAKGNRYNNDVIIKSMRISGKNLFSLTIDLSKINNEILNFNKQREDYLQESNKLIEAKNNIDRIFKGFKDFYSLNSLATDLHSMSRIKNNIKSIEIRSFIDTDKAKNKSKMLKLNIDRFINELEDKLALKDIPVLKFEEIREMEIENFNNLREIDYKKQCLNHLKKEIEDSDVKKTGLKKLIEAIADKMKSMQTKEDVNNLTPANFTNSQSQDIKLNTGKIINNIPPKISNFLEEMKDLPNEFSDINAEINILKCANKVLDPRGTIKTDFFAKENEFGNAQTSINNKRKMRQSLIVNYEETKNYLFKNLYENIKPINKRFQEFFKLFGYEGEINLEFGSEEDLKDKIFVKTNENINNSIEKKTVSNKKNVEFLPGKFMINILVKFRENGTLHKLSSGRQSGGEKSLTTVLFLLALHDKGSPFKLVDEINQGMDSNNEKKVFEVLKKMSEKSQFFIITPKLIPDIDYPENTNFIVLYGGKNMKLLEKYL